MSETISLTAEQAATVRDALAILNQFNLNGLAIPQLAIGIKLKDAIRELIAVKTAANLRTVYINSLQGYLNIFARGREDKPINSIKIEDIEQWFATRREKPCVRASNVGRLGSLFGYALRKGWISDNPCKRLERVRVDHRAPVIFTPKEAKALLKATPLNCRGFVTLAMFAGVRPEEVRSIKWEDIDLIRGQLTINISKTRRRRRVKLEPVAIAWLNTLPSRQGSIAPALITIKRMRIKLRSVVDWHQDILRHTAASYLMALYKDAGKVSTMLGNSQGILMKHYLELVSDDDCAKFWALTPDKVL